MSEELLPCPFCGAQPEILGLSFAVDIECECGASVTREDRAEAIAAWNRRAP